MAIGALGASETVNIATAARTLIRLCGCQIIADTFVYDIEPEISEKWIYGAMVVPAARRSQLIQIILIRLPHQTLRPTRC